jgi:hypothetical protein
MFKVLTMTNTIIAKTLVLSLATVAIVGCGPENNSRYGDEHWDPNKTKEQFDPIEAPEMEVVYFDNTAGDDTDDDFEARISVDFTEISRRSKDGLVVAQYQRGLSTPVVLDDLITSADSFNTDTAFWNDLAALEDKRLTTSTPGEYKFIFDFDVIWPNGNTVSYLFEDQVITVPGCQTSFLYYSDYINNSLADNCVACHSSGIAQTAMDLSSGNFDTRRGVFLNQVEDGPVDTGYAGTTLEYIFSADHSGQSSANQITGNALTVFNSYLNILIAKETADSAGFDAATDFTFTEDDGSGFCFARPSTFTVES